MMSTKDINRLADLIVGEIGKKDAFAGNRGCAGPSDPLPFDCPPADFICNADYFCGGAGQFNCMEFFDCLAVFECVGGVGPFNCFGQFNCSGQYIP